MTFFITFDLQHAMGGTNRMDTFSITPQYPSVFRFWCLVRYVCAIYMISQTKWRPDILVLMLKNILYLANFCLHIESFETKVLEMGYSCANHLMGASQDFPLSLSRNCHWLTVPLCPVLPYAPLKGSPLKLVTRCNLSARTSTIQVRKHGHLLSSYSWVMFLEILW
jgi:hypothetical protein